MDSQPRARGGRPSKYKKEYPEQMLAYFNEYLKEPFSPQIVEKKIKYNSNGSVKEEFYKYKNVSREVPTLFGFSLKVDVHHDTLLRWSKERVGTAPEIGTRDTRPYKYPEFYGAYKEVVRYQTQFLNIAGMSGAAPSIFAMFAAKNMIGWRDATEQRIVDKDGKDRAMPSYVILPARKTEEEADKEFEEQEEGDIKT